jgi:hypothetical protein
VAGDFFYQIVEQQIKDVSSNLSWNLTPEEKMFLLSASISWFNGADFE